MNRKTLIILVLSALAVGISLLSHTCHRPTTEPTTGRKIVVPDSPSPVTVPTKPCPSNR
jgi:hypothetical protein